MTLILAIRGGARVTVNGAGRIEYRSETGRTYRRESLGSYAESAAWVRGSAWGRDALYVQEIA